jgi:hypothetical protein
MESWVADGRTGPKENVADCQVGQQSPLNAGNRPHLSAWKDRAMVSPLPPLGGYITDPRNPI